MIPGQSLSARRASPFLFLFIEPFINSVLPYKLEIRFYVFVMRKFFLKSEDFFDESRQLMTPAWIFFAVQASLNSGLFCRTFSYKTVRTTIKNNIRLASVAFYFRFFSIEGQGLKLFRKFTPLSLLACIQTFFKGRKYVASPAVKTAV